MLACCDTVLSVGAVGRGGLVVRTESRGVEIGSKSARESISQSVLKLSSRKILPLIAKLARSLFQAEQTIRKNSPK